MNQRDVIEICEMLGLEESEYTTFTIMDALREYIAESMHSSQAPICAEIDAMDMAQAMIADAGIMVRENEGIEQNGVMHYYPRSRKAGPDDVASANIRGDQIAIILKDGNKHMLPMG